MEFGKKLQTLRKSRGLTQEELADALFVSRTAVSKWESGRGYPNIDSLKDISKFFSVSVDELLSGEKLISIAQKENKNNICSLCDLLFGFVDFLYFFITILPLFPNAAEEFIYSVNLFKYTQTTGLNLSVIWILSSLFIVLGVINIILSKTGNKNKIFMYISLLSNVLFVLFLAITRHTYAVTVVFLSLVIKTALFFKKRNEQSLIFEIFMS